MRSILIHYSVYSLALSMMACQTHPKASEASQDSTKALPKPLITELYTADPSAHVFEGKIYIYPSHDIETGAKQDEDGGHFGMKDYHVFSLDSVGGKVTDHGVALDIKDIPWAGRQLWAPDAAFVNGTYYLYFPVKDKQDVFRMGVATSPSPSGPFKPKAKPMEGTYSIDPAVFTDDDGQAYLYWGGISGGQLQRWRTGTYDAKGTEPGKDEAALSPKVGRLTKDFLKLEEKGRDAQIVDDAGNPLKAGDHDRRFFEGVWMHKYKGQYYLSYSTGDTHFLAYAVGSSPYGPFTYKGTFMNPVKGWTTHHSIVEFKGKWYLFYHDSELSGKTHLRNIKVREIKHTADGGLEMIEPYQ
ncbi:glycoside hydrolase family 43 protein [Siphonobacter sp. SORGH_AS_0500]|uniref:glycoside hydrolase family 43 protein n=1 Tax=Siphonobacter sp. SORGH_AS_0500 TaxID=1864824 RepID=UPI00285FE6B0|nr:hypothetical protein [Siphonobacter sp. SORGH_AS_0500]